MPERRHRPVPLGRGDQPHLSARNQTANQGGLGEAVLAPEPVVGRLGAVSWRWGGAPSPPPPRLMQQPVRSALGARGARVRRLTPFSQTEQPGGPRQLGPLGDMPPHTERDIQLVPIQAAGASAEAAWPLGAMRDGAPPRARSRLQIQNLDPSPGPLREKPGETGMAQGRPVLSVARYPPAIAQRSGRVAEEHQPAGPGRFLPHPAHHARA